MHYALLLRLYYMLWTLVTTVIISFAESTNFCHLSTRVDFLNLQSLCKFILQQKNIPELTRNQHKLHDREKHSVNITVS